MNDGSLSHIVSEEGITGDSEYINNSILQAIRSIAN